ncbi:amino acid kinase family protein, partial [Thermus scotoductus]|uniref:amino acid kinase family protein n=1 Tax=Thermus scotoductus TaxID=37636 RepID=UPI003F510644
MSEPLLVKVGGSLRGAETLLDELASYPGPLVLVHGGGPEIGAWLTRLGLESRFEGGLRVTPPEHMEVVEMSLCLTGKRLAEGLSRRGRRTLSLSGRDALCLRGKVLPHLGRVGDDLSPQAQGIPTGTGEGPSLSSGKPLRHPLPREAQAHLHHLPVLRTRYPHASLKAAFQTHAVSHTHLRTH